MTEETEVIEEQNEAQEVETQEPVENKNEVNWREASQVMKSQKAQIEAFQQEMAMLKAQMQPKPVEEPDEFATISKDEMLTFEQAQRLADKRAEKAVKKHLDEYKGQQEERLRNERIAMDEERVRQKYQDYDYVIEHFALPQIKNDPALAYKLQMSKNPAEAAYKLGKLSDSYEESMTKQTSPKAEKVLKNTSRPISGNAISPSLKSKADDFSKMSSQQIWEQSQKYARQA